jgi:cell volume regulation protein A
VTVVADTETFALILLFTAAVGLVAVMSNRLTEWVKIPSPALVLIGAAIAVKAIPALHEPPRLIVERVVTVALVCILFDGGMHIGWSRFRSAFGPIAAVGVGGTFLTVAAGGVLAHFGFALPWYVALLVATAVAPTDPAVVFSVLGQREVSGRGGTILEGESGANDPVGIALMASLIAAGGLSGGAFASVGGEFLLQLGVGAVVGVAGGRVLLWLTRRVPLPGEALYPLRTLACALLVFSIATLARGSGFLAVFAAGIVLGDEPAPFKREIERFHSAMASLAEIAAFVVLGLTVNLSVLARTDVWIPGVVLSAALAFVIRPALIGLCLIPARLPRGDRNFVLFAGLKGAVPILLGSFLLAAGIPGAQRLYGIVAVVVIFSVVVQGSLVPAAARLLRVQMRTVEPEPWALGVRLRDEPSDVHRLTIAAGSLADGRTIADLSDLPGDAWVSFIVRDGRLVPIKADTTLRAGDDVLVLADADLGEKLTSAFEGPGPRPGIPAAETVNPAEETVTSAEELAELAVAGVDDLRLDAEDLGELLDHHVEDEFAQVVLVFGPGQQRPPEQHDARSGGRVPRVADIGRAPDDTRQRDAVLIGGIEVRHFLDREFHVGKLRLPARLEPRHGLEHQVVELLGPAPVKRNAWRYQPAAQPAPVSVTSPRPPDREGCARTRPARKGCARKSAPWPCAPWPRAVLAGLHSHRAYRIARCRDTRAHAGQGAQSTTRRGAGRGWWRSAPRTDTVTVVSDTVPFRDEVSRVM